MKFPVVTRLAAASALIAGVGVTAFSLTSTAGASARFQFGNQHALFVQTESPSGNQIISYNRSSDGTVAYAGTYATRGLGGVAVSAVADPIASQDGLLLADGGNRLIAVNAGSNTVSVFAVEGAQLHLIQVIGSGGEFPVSVAASNNNVAVLNAGGAGGVTQYQWRFGLLNPQDQSRALGLHNTNPPFFTSGPGEVAYSPNGAHLIVADKNSANQFQVFAVSPNGNLGAKPVDTAAQNNVPFSFVFDAQGHVVATEASNSSLSTYALNADGTLGALGTATDAQAALCWVSTAQGFFFGSNAGSGNVSSFSVTANGAVALVNGVAATTHPGTTDSVASPDGDFLYVESGGSGALDVWGVGANGSLSPVETLWNIPVASEGLAVS